MDILGRIVGLGGRSEILDSLKKCLFFCQQLQAIDQV